MSDLNARQIIERIVRALEYVGKRFDEDPTPTDGSLEAARKKLGMRSSVHVYRPTAVQRRKAKR